MRFKTLSEWLAWQETLHPQAIDLGLERVAEVARRMQLLAPSHAVITVAGTNGKGSSVAMLESILVQAGYRVGSYTSPHLWRYNERIRIQQEPATDEAIMAAFARIDAARGDISLSYFEFGTLAALDIMQRSGLDVAVLEVGLGGRLDAVNILAADCALVTGIDIDHTEWLGNDREAIGREKAGIFRPGRPAVCSDPAPPAAVGAVAAALAAPYYPLGQAFGFRSEGDHWEWWSGDNVLHTLPHPALQGPFQLQNAAGVLMALACLDARLPVSRDAICEGLRRVRMRGRFEIVPGPVETLFDVAHNPHAARALAVNLQTRPCAGRTLAVCGLLADKDAAGIADALTAQVHAWYLGGLAGPRGQSAQALAARLSGRRLELHLFDDVATALAAARRAARPGDRVVVFGSFHTIAELLPNGL